MGAGPVRILAAPRLDSGRVVIDEDLLPHLVDVEHPGTRLDGYENEEQDWSPEAVTRVQVQAWLQQNSGAEVLDQRSAQIGEWLLMCNPWDVEGQALTIHGEDRLSWEGLAFEVIGPPGPAYAPDELHHFEVRLRAVEG